MSRCRRTDAIAAIVADPGLGIEALTDEHWQHIGICADCNVAVRNLERLDHALTASLRSQPREELPPSVLATPPLPRHEAGAPLGPMLAMAAVIVLAVGVATVGGDWLNLRGIGISPAGTPNASPGLPTASADPASPIATPSGTASPTDQPTAAPTPVTEPLSLSVGEVAGVVDEPLVVRTAPGTDPDSTITPDRLWVGQRVRILDGPADVDGYTWWEVQVGEIRGWVADAELDGSKPWLAPVADGRVWFWRDPGETGSALAPELFSVGVDGSDERDHGDPREAALQNVLSCGYYTGQLEWRHDGSAAAFSVAPGCELELYLVSADGAEVRRLGDGGPPAWRPDGELIVFAPNGLYMVPPEDGSRELHQVTPDGEPVRLTDSGTDVQTGFPTWAPDRTRIAYQAWSPPDGSGSSEYQILVVDADGSAAEPLIEGMYPRWSPDGRWIYYQVSNDDHTVLTLWRIRPDGTGAHDIGEVVGQAAISPDGSRLAVQRDDGVWTMDADGSGASLAIPATAVDGFAWAPSGDALLVASNYPGGDQIGISTVRLDGEAPAITGIVAQGHAPSWQPLIVAPTD